MHQFESYDPAFNFFSSLANIIINMHYGNYGLWSFQAGGTKLEIFLLKNQPKGNY